MKTPNKITGEQFITEKEKFGSEDTKYSEHGVQLCKKCGSFIHTSLVYIGIHSKGNPCEINLGEVLAEELEYCPECEEVPEGKGCVHV